MSLLASMASTLDAQRPSPQSIGSASGVPCPAALLRAKASPEAGMPLARAPSSAPSPETQARARGGSRELGPEGVNRGGGCWLIRASRGRGTPARVAGRFHPQQPLSRGLGSNPKDWQPGLLLRAVSVPSGLIPGSAVVAGQDGRGEAVSNPQNAAPAAGRPLALPATPSLHHVYCALTRCQAALGAGASEINSAIQVASRLGVEIQYEYSVVSAALGKAGGRRFQPRAGGRDQGRLSGGGGLLAER